MYIKLSIICFFSICRQVMAQSEEPPEKRAHTEINYTLCIKCQSSKREQLKELPQSVEHSTFDKYLTAVCLERVLGTVCYTQWKNQGLDSRWSKWQTHCVAQNISTNSVHKTWWKQACATSDVSLLQRTIGRSATSSHYGEHELSVSGRYTCSKSTNYDKSKCFFCQGKLLDVSHDCRSGNIGTLIHDIVQHFNNTEWKVKYA